MPSSRKKIDVAGIITRILKAGHPKTYKEITTLLGINPQYIYNAKARGSFPLAKIVSAAEMFNVSMDYLVYGTDPGCETYGKKEKQDVYLEIEEIGGGKIKLLANLFNRRVNSLSLKAHKQNDCLYVIDSAEVNVTDGIYAFGKPGPPVILRCKADLDGSISIEGRKEPQSVDYLIKYCWGRVIWSGSSQ